MDDLKLLEIVLFGVQEHLDGLLDAGVVGHGSVCVAPLCRQRGISKGWPPIGVDRIVSSILSVGDPSSGHRMTSDRSHLDSKLPSAGMLLGSGLFAGGMSLNVGGGFVADFCRKFGPRGKSPSDREPF